MKKSNCKTQSSVVRTMLVAGAMLFAFDAAVAQDSESQVPQVESSIGVDVTNQYFFRGLIQETKGTIAQPWFDLVFPFGEGENTSWSFNLGTWSSLHDGPSGSGGAGMSMYYEVDAYVGIGVDFADNWSGSVSFIALTSPNSAFGTVKELDFSLSFDDSGESGGFPGVSPSVTLAVELDGQSDGGSDEGIYLEIGIEPAFDLIKSENLPISVALPAAAGFSLSNYFEDGMGNDEFFGFAQVGVVLSTPLSFIPTRQGDWTLSGGVNFLFLGDNLEAINGGENSEVILSLGLGIAF